VIDEALAEGRVYLPPIVVAELLSGKMTTRQRRQLESFLLDLPLCEPSLEHWMRVGSFRAHLFSKGLSISTPDAHIAQCALDLNAELLSEDQVFFKITQKTSLRLLS
jgi:predicted nucleic acid-binding protein